MHASTESILHLRKYHLQHTHHRMKQHADKKRTNCDFQIGGMVYLKLQVYKQILWLVIHFKSFPRDFIALFKVVDKVSKVSYTLDDVNLFITWSSNPQQSR